MINSILLSILMAITYNSRLSASSLVSKQTIEKQSETTTTFKLKNGIPVIYRKVENSDILYLEFNWRWGYKDQSTNQKTIAPLMFQTMSEGAKKWSKGKIFETSEAYSSSVKCFSGIEVSSCSLSGLSDYWDKTLPMFAAIINNPSFEKRTIEIAKERKEASIKESKLNPEAWTNEVVNKIYYPKGHPYWISSEKSLSQIKAINPESLKKLHKKLHNSSLHYIVAVGNLPISKMKKDLNKKFAGIKKQAIQRTMPIQPNFNPKKALNFEARKIPTAYIRIKFNTPGKHENNAPAAELMLRILSEELGNEIRTKRSLSYAIYAYGIQYHIGIGLIAASTSNPKETIEAIHQVIQKIKEKPYSKKEIANFKTEYTTRYFLTLEEHKTLGSALSDHFLYHRDPLNLYRYPEKIDAITAKDIQTAARSYLKNFRIGVIYDETKFQKKWAVKFINENQ